MRTLIRWAARLYRATWDVLWDVIRVRAISAVDACLVPAAVSPMTSRLPVVVSLTAHALLIPLVLLAASLHVSPVPLRVMAVPSTFVANLATMDEMAFDCSIHESETA